LTTGGPVPVDLDHPVFLPLVTCPASAQVTVDNWQGASHEYESKEETEGEEDRADKPKKPRVCKRPKGEPVTIAAAKLFIEYMATDGDLGVHGLFDDQGWRELCVYDPRGTLVLQVTPQSQLRDLTLAGIFFESREPPLAEFSFDDLKTHFSAGEYTVVGTNYDGTGLVGAATFTHDLPAPPVITAPVVVEEEAADEAVVSIDNLVVEWEDVTATVEGNPVTITGYEIIITKVEHEDPHGLSRPIYDVHVPADRNRLSVPIEFLESGTLYELEVLALEESGNQTITAGFFTTAD
jgi:hypothetical protein